MHRLRSCLTRLSNLSLGPSASPKARSMTRLSQPPRSALALLPLSTHPDVQQLVVATTVNLLVYDLKSTASEKGKAKASAPISVSLELLQTVERPTLPSNFTSSSFRAARFHPTDEGTLYTVLNTVPPRTRARHAPYTSFVCKWDAGTWTMTKARKISDKRATCFAVRSVLALWALEAELMSPSSPDGKLLAYGAADLCVGVLDSKSLAVRHELPARSRYD
jgi:prolactin regulatory element-binding protein